MDDSFCTAVEALDPSFRRLIAMAALKALPLPRGIPARGAPGVYLFSEGDQHLYVGRTNRLRERLLEHGRPSSRHDGAPFAFLLAREKTVRTIASYKKNGSRRDLEGDPQFADAFMAAKRRVRAMNIRFIEERDPLRQALLEIYVAVALRTPYNDFDTH